MNIEDLTELAQLIKLDIEKLVEFMKNERYILESNEELSTGFVDDRMQIFLELKEKVSMFFDKCQNNGLPTQWNPLLKILNKSQESMELYRVIQRIISLWEELIHQDKLFLNILQLRSSFISNQLQKIQQGKTIKNSYQENRNIPAVFMDYKK
ncbi:MAG: hypothetical protein M1480_13705 [Bacteroidetes bacterium]|nr:hypothetical protein [Bacteroidota bacterium]